MQKQKSTKKTSFAWIEERARAEISSSVNKSQITYRNLSPEHRTEQNRSKLTVI